MSPGETAQGKMAKAAVSPAEQETIYLALRNTEGLRKGTRKKGYQDSENLCQGKEGETVMDGGT